jgi:hypothetical protein
MATPAMGCLGTPRAASVHIACARWLIYLGGANLSLRQCRKGPDRPFAPDPHMSHWCPSQTGWMTQDAPRSPRGRASRTLAHTIWVD